MRGPYDDILHLPHHVSQTRPQMSLSDRAAQFSPFQALTGYGAAIQEAARRTDRRAELTEERKAELDGEISILRDSLPNDTVASITYFVPDDRKEGGAYVTVAGVVRKIDVHRGVILLADSTEIPIREITDMDSPLFRRTGD